MKKIFEFLQTKEDGKDVSSFGAKARKIAAYVLAFLLFIVVVQIAVFFGVFSWITSHVRAVTGLDMYLVKGISFFLMALLFGTPLFGTLWSFLPISQKKRKKRFIFLTVLSTLFIISFFTSRDVYFNPSDGEPAKYYSIGSNGEYKFSSSDGYDTETGDKLMPVTKEVILKSKRTEGVSVVKEVKEVKENSLDDVERFYRYNLTGAERNANFYPVTFTNETGRNIYLCYSFRYNENSPVIRKQILAGESKTVDLMEGKHNFTYMDVNGTCFGKRDGGKLLTTSTGELRVAIGKQTYFSTSTFLLDVTASNETVVTLKDDIVKHNLDKDTGDKEKSEMMYIILGLAVLGFISLICMALDKLSNPKQQ